jgi:toxin ParE1/3/4
LRTIRVSPAARRDILDLAARSEAEFGREARDRYLALVESALLDLQADAARPGVGSRPDLPDGLRLYHQRQSRPRVRAQGRVGTPRHFIVFRLAGNEIIVVRVLHDAMDLGRRL